MWNANSGHYHICILPFLQGTQWRLLSAVQCCPHSNPGTVDHRQIKVSLEQRPLAVQFCRYSFTGDFGAPIKVQSSSFLNSSLVHCRGNTEHKNFLLLSQSLAPASSVLSMLTGSHSQAFKGYWGLNLGSSTSFFLCIRSTHININLYIYQNIFSLNKKRLKLDIILPILGHFNSVLPCQHKIFHL